MVARVVDRELVLVADAVEILEEDLIGAQRGLERLLRLAQLGGGETGREGYVCHWNILVFRHCERSEAIQSGAEPPLACRATFGRSQ
jgi:hypothetical protein